MTKHTLDLTRRNFVIGASATGAGLSLGFAVPFGQAQEPEVWDYADGVDTLKFLESLN